MTDTGSTTRDDRLVQLEAEADRLRLRVRELEQRPQRRRVMRRLAATLFLVLAVLAFAVAVPGAWARRTLLDTDRYVALVAPLPQDPAVQEYLSRTITTAVFESLSVEERLNDALEERAPRLGFLAGPLTNGVRGFVQDRVRSVVSSEVFASFWTQANRFVHEQLVSALRGEEGGLVSADGKVVLDLLPIVNETLRRIATLASELIGRDLSLPEVTPEEVPAEVIPRLEAALDVDLPDRFGTIVIYDGNEIAAVQRAVDLFARGIVLAALAFLVLAVAALWSSPSKRRTLVQLASALLVVLVVERRFAFAAADRVVEQAMEANRAAAGAVVDRVVGSLAGYTGWLLLIIVTVLLVALLTGPYPWAVRLRDWVRGASVAVVGDARERPPSRAAESMAAHRDALMLGGAGLAAAIFLVADLSIGGAIVVTALLAMFELVVYRVAAATRDRGAVPAGGTSE
jgi:hypothetical protein